MFSDCNSPKIRVILIEECDVRALGRKMLLEQHSSIEVIGATSSKEEAIQWIHSYNPETILMNLRKKFLDDLLMIQRIKKLSPGSQLLILAEENCCLSFEWLIEAGASGLLLADTSYERIVHAIICHQDSVVILPQSMYHWCSTMNTMLTKLELKTAALAAAGYTNSEVACAMFVSKRTIENRLTTIYQKMGISGRYELSNFEQRMLIKYGTH